MIGAKGPDRLFAGAGDDLLSGGKGPDTLKGGPDDDSLFAGKASDRSSTARPATTSWSAIAAALLLRCVYVLLPGRTRGRCWWSGA